MSEKEKTGWYLGKNLGRRPSTVTTATKEKERDSEDSSSSSRSSITKPPSSVAPPDEEGKWYPGKYAGKAMRRNSTNSPSTDAVTTRASIDSGSVTSNNSKRPFLGKQQSGSLIGTAIGIVNIDIFGIKYCNVEKPCMRLELDGQIFEYREFRDFIEINVPFSDIDSQILITMTEEYSIAENEVVGQIIVPLRTYIGATKPFREFRMFFPLRSYAYGNPIGRFQAGLETVTGSGMTKCREAIGFLDIMFGVSMNEGSPYELYFRPNYCLPLSPAYRDKNQELNVLAFNWERDLNRWRRLLSPPSMLAPLMTLPRVAVLIVVSMPTVLLGYFCFGLWSWQFPLAVTFIIFFNGILTMTSRNYNHVLVWNEGFAPIHRQRGFLSSASNNSNNNSNNINGSNNSSDMNAASLTSASLSPNALYVKKSAAEESLQSISFKVCQLNSNVVSAAEKIANLLSFAEPRMSQMAYGFLFLLSFALSVFIYMGTMRMVVFLVGAVWMVALSLRLQSTDDESGATPQQTLLGFIFPYLDRFRNFAARIPDELELTHRYIAGLTFVREDGAEMLDAAEARKTS